MIDRGVFKSSIDNKEIKAYNVYFTKFQWNKHPVPDYKMVNAHHIMVSFEKTDIIQNCVCWKHKAELHNIFSTTATTKGLELPLLYTYSILIPIYFLYC